MVGLELGADDYVVKPFSPKEMLARVRAVPAARPALGRAADGGRHHAGRRHPSGHRVGRPLTLTPKEFDSSARSSRRAGACSRASLDRVWGHAGRRDRVADG